MIDSCILANLFTYFLISHLYRGYEFPLDVIQMPSKFFFSTDPTEILHSCVQKLPAALKGHHQVEDCGRWPAGRLASE